MQFGGVIGMVKLLAFIIIGLFIFKLASKVLSDKFPNKVTNSLNSVVQAA